MPDEAVIAYFDGDPALLEERYAEAVRRYVAAGLPAPQAAHVFRRTSGIAAVLLWSSEVGHDAFGAHVASLLTELDLPFPTVDHFDVARPTWSAMAESVD